MYPMLALLVVVAIPVLLAFQRLGGFSGGRPNVGAIDPRVAAAAMVFAVAREGGAPDRGRMEELAGLLAARLRLDEREARSVLADGQRLAGRTSGSLNSRLHQLRGPIERSCDEAERRDVVEMLRAAAGASLERTPSVREAVGRIAASLLHG